MELQTLTYFIIILASSSIAMITPVHRLFCPSNRHPALVSQMISGTAYLNPIIGLLSMQGYLPLPLHGYLTTSMTGCELFGIAIQRFFPHGTTLPLLHTSKH
jgi:hypothetical protein